MRQPKTIADIYEEVAERSSPFDVVLEPESYKLQIAQRAGIDLEELEKLEAQGLLDKRLSLKLYGLSLLAVDALISEIASGNATPEVLSKLALEGAKVAQKLAGRDVNKHLVLTADYWELVLRSNGEE